MRRIFCSQSLALGIFQVEFTWRHLPSVNCINYGFFLEPLQNTVLPKTSSTQVTGPQKFLNDTNLILNDQRGHSDSFRINFIVFSIMYSVTGRSLFFKALYFEAALAVQYTRYHIRSYMKTRYVVRQRQLKITLSLILPSTEL